MSRLDDISTRNVATFAILAIAAAFIFTTSFSIVSADTTLSLDGCTLNQNGDTYTVTDCFVDNNQLSSNTPVAYDTDSAQFSEFDLRGPGHVYTEWTQSYLVDQENFDRSQFEMECSDSFDFMGDAREIDFCTNSQDMADRYQQKFGGTDVSGNTYSTGNIGEKTGYDYVIRTGFPRQVRDALRQQSTCTATLTSYEGVTVQADGQIAFVRSEVGGSRIDSMSCVVDLPQEHRGYGQHSIKFTFDADFTEDTDTGTGGAEEPEEPTTEPVGVFEQVRLTVINLFNRIVGVFQ